METGQHLAPPSKGKCCLSRAEGCDSVPRADTHTHPAPGCHLPQRKIKSPHRKTVATWEKPSKQNNDIVSPRGLSHRWGGEQTNLWSVAAKGKGVRIIWFRMARRTATNTTVLLHRTSETQAGCSSWLHSPRLLRTPSWGSLRHRALVRNTRRGTAAHCPHLGARTAAVREATPTFFRVY